MCHHQLNNVCHSAGTMPGRPGHQSEVTARLNSGKTAFRLSAFSVRAADKWNSTPSHIREASVFLKQHLKQGSGQTDHVITDLSLYVEPTVLQHVVLYVMYCFEFC